MKAVQNFGTDDEKMYNKDTDEVTKIKISKCNNFLFTGDASGRIVIFRKRKVLKIETWEPIYQYFGTKAQLDYLTSEKVDNRVVDIIPIQYNEKCMYNMIADTKNIYFHKIHSPMRKEYTTSTIFNVSRETMTTNKRSYTNCHKYVINSIGVSKCYDYIYSADDLNVNMWNIERPNMAMPVINTVPNDISTITSTITKMKLNPLKENIIYTCSSNGVVSTFDTRQQCITTNPVSMFYSSKMASYDSAEHVKGNIFKRREKVDLQFISDIDISPDAQYIVTRSPLFINIWDTRYTLNPCHYFPIHKHIYPLIKEECDLAYENFEIKYSSNGQYIYSGSFDNIITIDTNDYSYHTYNDVKKQEIGIKTPRHLHIDVDSDNQFLFLSYNGVLGVYVNT